MPYGPAGVGKGSGGPWGPAWGRPWQVAEKLKDLVHILPKDIVGVLMTVKCHDAFEPPPHSVADGRELRPSECHAIAGPAPERESGPPPPARPRRGLPREGICRERCFAEISKQYHIIMISFDNGKLYCCQRAQCFTSMPGGSM